MPGSTTLWRCTTCGLYQNGRLAETSEYSADYHQCYEHRREKKLRTARVRLNRIAPLVQVDSPRLLDIGSSVGCVVEAAIERGWDAVGTDVSASAVAFCRQRNLPCRLISGNVLPFADNSIDVLTSWHVIEHVADVATTLADWFRVLRPGGVMAPRNAGRLVAHCPATGKPVSQILGARTHVHVFARNSIGLSRTSRLRGARSTQTWSAK